MKCRVDRCENEANVAGAARDLCRAHYRRWQRYGDENEPLRRISSWKGEMCCESGCSKPAKSHGLCVNHHALAARSRRRKLDPEGQRRRNNEFKRRYRIKQEQLMGRPRPAECESCESCGSCGSRGYGRGNKPGISICFDHDHATGKPRGWLCDRCNKMLGMAADSAELLLKLALYLEQHRG